MKQYFEPKYLIQKRSTMKSKNKTFSNGFKMLFAIPTAFALVVMFSFTGMANTNTSPGNSLQTPQQKLAEKTTIKFTPPQITKKGDNPMENPEKSPEFKGGMNGLMKYLGSNIHYPAVAKKAKTEGTVFVQFVVTKTGKVSNVKVQRGISLECDKEAIRVVKAMPDWTPGQDKGKPVSTIFQLPIKFQLASKK